MAQIDSAETASLPPRRNVRREEIAGLGPYVAPTGIGQARMARIWAAALELDRVGADDDFFALGGDSLPATVIFAEIERQFGQRLATATILEAPTVARLVAVLEGDPREFASRILVPFRQQGAKPPLVIVHGHNGRVLFVQRLLWHLPPGRPIYAIQARGLDGRVPPHDSVPEMVADYARELVAAFGRGPIFLAGYCYGGILAIEVHRHLVAAGLEVPRLIMIDPPAFPRKKTQEYTPEELAQTARARSEGLVSRLERMARKQPELAAWYAPGAPGHVNAISVAEALAVAYARFIPQPTTAPMSLIWSEQFANGLQRRRTRWRLAEGPCETKVVIDRDGSLTHHDLIRANSRVVALYLEEVMASYRGTAAPG